MTSPRATDAERWKSLDAASYDEVADDYDVHSHRIALPAARHLVELAALRDGERVLDVGTGTGMIPFEIARTAPASCSVLGVDISTGMIETAQARVVAAGLDATRVSFRRMDAETLDLPDRQFDVVVSAFALGHIPTPEKAVAEMFRVLRPGGRFVIAVGSRPPIPSLFALKHAWHEVGRRLETARRRRVGSTLLDELTERHAPPIADAPAGSHIATRLDRTKPVSELLAAAGFVEIGRTWSNYQNEVDSVEEFWAIQRTICTTARKRLLGASPEIVGRIREEFVSTCSAAIARGGKLVFPISAIFVQGRKPSA